MATEVRQRGNPHRRHYIAEGVVLTGREKKDWARCTKSKTKSGGNMIKKSFGPRVEQQNPVGHRNKGNVRSLRTRFFHLDAGP